MHERGAPLQQRPHLWLTSACLLAFTHAAAEQQDGAAGAAEPAPQEHASADAAGDAEPANPGGTGVQDVCVFALGYGLH